MAYTFSIKPVLDLLRGYILDNFTGQGETPSAIPYTFAAASYPVEASNLPLTLIEVQELKPNRKQIMGGSIDFDLPVIIHHVRQRDTSGNAEITSVGLLANLAAAIENDWKWQSLGDANTTIAFKQIEVMGLSMGADNPAEQHLNSTQQQSGMCVVSLGLKICWSEYR